jgi:hypothetical protein
MATVRQIELLQKERAERELRMWFVVEAMLDGGPKASRELVLALGRKSYGEGARTVAWLRSLERKGKIVRAGEALGPTGHRNIVWALA